MASLEQNATENMALARRRELQQQAQADAEKSGLRHELETERGAAAAARREAAAAAERRSGLEAELREERSVTQRKEAAHKQGEAEIGTLRAKEAREATELAQSRRRLERATQGRFLSDQTQAGEE